MIASTSSEGAERAGQYEPQNQRVCVRIHAYTCMYIDTYGFVFVDAGVVVVVLVRTTSIVHVVWMNSPWRLALPFDGSPPSSTRVERQLPLKRS